MAHVLDFLIDSLVELVPLCQVGTGATLDPLSKFLQENLQLSVCFSSVPRGLIPQTLEEDTAC